MNSLHPRLGYMSHTVGYTGYNTFAPVTAPGTMASYHPSDVIYGAAAAAGVAPLRPSAAPPPAHSQTQAHLITSMTTSPEEDMSGMCSPVLHESISDQLDGIALDGSKRISSISSLRLKAKRTCSTSCSPVKQRAHYHTQYEFLLYLISIFSIQ